MTSSSMAMGQSTAIGVGSKLTRLIDAVTVSIYVTPIMESWHSHVNIVVMPFLTKRPGEVASPGGRLIVM